MILQFSVENYLSIKEKLSFSTLAALTQNMRNISFLFRLFQTCSTYILAKLKGAGCTRPVFDDAAMEAILNAADGTPRIINKLCNASLLIGHSSGLNIITTNAVMQAVNDCELG